MDHLWSLPPGSRGLTVREVHDALSGDRAYTTVMTVLDRLARKGLVERERDGRAWRYAAAATRDRLTAETMRRTLGDLGAPDRRAALLHFLDASSPAELEELRAAVAELQRRQDPGRG